MKGGTTGEVKRCFASGERTQHSTVAEGTGFMHSDPATTVARAAQSSPESQQRPDFIGRQRQMEEIFHPAPGEEQQRASADAVRASAFVDQAIHKLPSTSSRPPRCLKASATRRKCRRPRLG